ncbi:AMP-binding protein [Methylobacterium sp. SyP6R]|uniref:AMP-binding protein n=1 Tax=Methylobacterium sp. SyP6R TaxID=2718876 RepID=UPI001F2DCCD3|nr:AMP-binding protein [Methylobacterium sp. SyP6R]MCF4130029.1 AMP-binding protein [Methylobacterium sp. SyP6R]
MANLTELLTRYRDRDDRFVAVVDGERESYRAFFTRIDRWQSEIGTTVPAGGIVLIDGVKTLDAVAAGVASLLAEGGVSYLDLTLPSSRTSQIVTAMRPALHLVHGGDGISRHVPVENSPRRFAGSVVFTSGTTGQPKGVFSATEALAHYVDSMLDCMGDNRQTWLSICPLHFDVFQLDVLVQLARGADIILASNTLLPHQYLNIIADEGVTEVLYISTLLKMTVEMVDTAPKHDLRTIYYGGEGCSTAVLGRAMALFSGIEWCQFYGPTENCNNTTHHRFRTLRPTATGFMPLGRPIRHVHIGVVDADGRSCPVGEVGEIVLSGPQLFSGYLDTATGRFDPHRGAYHSKDLGYFDEAGDLWFTGRKDDIVKINGNRVSLVEIDNHIRSFVKDATVLTAVKEHRGFQVLVSGVHSPASFEPDEIIAHLRSVLPNYCVPTEVIRLPDDKVTRLSTGKTNYKLIKEFIAYGNEDRNNGQRRDQ